MSSYACSQKSPSLDINGSDYAGADVEDSDKAGSKTVKKSPQAPAVETTPSTPEIARNEPPATGLGDPDEEISPPVNQTGSPQQEKPNDPSQIVKNGYYLIKGAGSMKCLAVPQNSHDNAVQLEQRTCDPKSNYMKFEIEYIPADKGYRISNKANQKFLEVRNQSEVIQGAIQQNDFFAMPHQYFVFEAKESNRYHIRTKVKQLFVDVASASVHDGALIQLWGDGNGISSIWILEPTL